MLTKFADYAEKYESIHMERHDGILQMRLHTGDGPLLSSLLVHHELPAAFADVSNDNDTLCVIMTGTGDAFWPGHNPGPAVPSRATNADWYDTVKCGTKLVTNFLDIDVPVITAVNGPWSRHSELVVLSDIVLATPNTVFQDSPHFWNGLVPGDGMAPAWMLALGPNRLRYFLLTGQQLDAEEAYDLGVVNEIVEPDELLDRAWELAREIIKRSPLTIRYTKMVIAADLRRQMSEQLSYTLIAEGAATVDEGGRNLGLLAPRTTAGDGTGFARKRRRPADRQS